VWARRGASANECVHARAARGGTRAAGGAAQRQAGVARRCGGGGHERERTAAGRGGNFWTDSDDVAIK
jgi:hypothetical protein